MTADKQIGNRLGVVKICDCGGVKLSVGRTTLHFSPNELPLLRDLVEKASKLSESTQRGRPLASTRGRSKSSDGTFH